MIPKPPKPETLDALIKEKESELKRRTAELKQAAEEYKELILLSLISGREDGTS